MARLTPIVTNFTAGELSEDLAGRQDLDWYRNGTKTSRNMISTAQGPARRRPGTVFTAAAKNQSLQAALLDFTFSPSQAYILEFGDRYIRVFTDRAAVVAVAGGATIGNGNFDSDISGWTDRSTGGGSISHDTTNKRANLNGGGGIAAMDQVLATTAPTQTHALAFQVFGAPGDVLQFKVGTSPGTEDILAVRDYGVGHHVVEFIPNSGAYYLNFLHGLGKTLQIDNVALIDGPVEVVSPYAAADVDTIKKDRSNDVLFLTHPDYALRVLKRYGHASWSLEELAFIDGPYEVENTGEITLTPTAATGLGITLTASEALFAASDINRLVRLNHSGTWGYGIIVAYTSPSAVTVDIRTDFGAIAATKSWRRGVFSDTTGHPAAGSFHEARLTLGGATENPDRGDGSASFLSGFRDFTPDTADGAAISFVLASKINWFASEAALIVGTAARVYRVGSLVQEAPLTPSNTPNKPAIHVRCANIAPVRAGTAVLFLQALDQAGTVGQALFEIAYSLQDNGLSGKPLTLRAGHLYEPGVIRLAYQETPHSIVWGVRADGLLLGMTYVPAEGITAHHHHPVGGGGIVESAATIPGPAGDELWLLVRRTIGGATKRYIERLADFAQRSTPAEDLYHVDCGLIYDGAPATVLTGLDHLEGETIQALVDGAVHDDVTVAGGQITLSVAGSKVHAGYYYDTELEPVAFAGGELLAAKRVAHAGIRFDRTNAAEYGRAGGKMEVLPFRTVSMAMDTAVPLYTGLRKVNFPGDWGDEARFIIRQARPLPLGVVSLQLDLEANRA